MVIFMMNVSIVMLSGCIVALCLKTEGLNKRIKTLEKGNGINVKQKRKN